MSVHPVSEIVRGAGCEWYVVVDLGEEAYQDAKPVDDLARICETFFPYAPPVYTNVYGLPFLRNECRPCVATVPTEFGALLYSPQTTAGRLYNEKASALAGGSAIHGVAVVLCASEADAAAAAAAAEAAPRVGWVEARAERVVRRVTKLLGLGERP